MKEIYFVFYACVANQNRILSFFLSKSLSSIYIFTISRAEIGHKLSPLISQRNIMNSSLCDRVQIMTNGHVGQLLTIQSAPTATAHNGLKYFLEKTSYFYVNAPSVSRDLSYDSTVSWKHKRCMKMNAPSEIFLFHCVLLTITTIFACLLRTLFLI